MPSRTESGSNKGYRYRKTGRLKVGDGIIFVGGYIFWIRCIERDPSVEDRLVFRDEKNDDVLRLDAGEIVRIASAAEARTRVASRRGRA